MAKYVYYLQSIFRLLTGIKNWPRVVAIFLGLLPPGRHIIHLRPGNIRLAARGKMDIWSLKETFLDRFYERYGMRVQDGWTIVDIGGGIGDYTIFAARQNPTGRVIAFEPTPQSFGLLQENLALNHIDNVQAFPEAIWYERGELTINTGAGEPGQFTSHIAVGGQASVTVPSIPLEEAFTRLNIATCDLLKMDCEGAEYGIFFNTPDSVLSKIRRVVMEYHDAVSAYSHRDLATFLYARGFKVEVFPNIVHPELGYLRAWQPTTAESN